MIRPLFGSAALSFFFTHPRFGADVTPGRMCVARLQDIFKAWGYT